MELSHGDRDEVADTRAWELTPRIGRPATAALELTGLRRYADLTTTTPRTLLRIHGVGPKAIRSLEEELSARGRSFARD